MNEDRFARPARVRWSTTWNAGYAPHWRRCRANPTRRQRSCTRSNYGRHCCATATTAPSRSTTRRQNALCAASRSAAATTCLPAPTAAASALPPSILDRDGQAQLRRSRGLVASCAGPYRRPSSQPRRRLPALELLRAVTLRLKNPPLPSGVMPSSSNSAPHSRRR